MSKKRKLIESQDNIPKENDELKYPITLYNNRFHYLHDPLMTTLNHLPEALINMIVDYLRTEFSKTFDIASLAFQFELNIRSKQYKFSENSNMFSEQILLNDWNEAVEAQQRWTETNALSGSSFSHDIQNRWNEIYEHLNTGDIIRLNFTNRYNDGIWLFLGDRMVKFKTVSLRYCVPEEGFVFTSHGTRLDYFPNNYKLLLPHSISLEILGRFNVSETVTNTNGKVNTKYMIDDGWFWTNSIKQVVRDDKAITLSLPKYDEMFNAGMIRLSFMNELQTIIICDVNFLASHFF